MGLGRHLGMRFQGAPTRHVVSLGDAESAHSAVGLEIHIDHLLGDKLRVVVRRLQSLFPFLQSRLPQRSYRGDLVRNRKASAFKIALHPDFLQRKLSLQSPDPSEKPKPSASSFSPSDRK